MGKLKGRLNDFLNHDGMSEACMLSDEGKQLSEVITLSLTPPLDKKNNNIKHLLSVLWKNGKRKPAVIADRDYTPGDQVQIRYGKFSNGTLLLDFGFTLPFNMYDQVGVELKIPDHDDLHQMKLKLLDKYRARAIKDVNGFRSSENLFTIKEVKSANRKGRGIPQSFRAFARVLCSNSHQELNDLAMEAEQNDGRLGRCPLKNKSREIEAHQFMLSKITQLIREYDTSIKAIGRLQISDDMIKKCAIRRQMAHDLLTGELRVLKSASAWLKNYCASLIEG